MLKKKQLKSKPVCKVTFELPKDVKAEGAYLVGDFNAWDESGTPMKKLKDGRLTVTVDLAQNAAYQFRYKLADGRWDNDWKADAYTTNPFGSDNSVVYT